MSEDSDKAPPAQFSIGTVLRHSFAVIRFNFPSFAAIAIAIILLEHLPVLLQDRAVDRFSWWNIALQFSGKYIIGGCADAALTYGTLLMLSGSAPSFRDLMRGLSFAVPVTAVIAITDLPSIGFVLLGADHSGQSQIRLAKVAIGLAGTALFALWLAAVPAVVAEYLRPLAALRRSMSLTGGKRWHIFALVLVGGFVFQLPLLALSVIDVVSAESESTSLLLMLWTMEYVLPAISVIFWSVAATVTYCSLRLVKEGTSIRQLVRVFD